jgi:hypothetical protein
MYSVLYTPTGRILCSIWAEGIVVGFAVLRESEDAFRGESTLLIEVAQFDNTPGILEAAIAEWDRLAETDGYDVVRFFFERPGWQKRMKMLPDAGYKQRLFVGEKHYGR